MNGGVSGGKWDGGGPVRLADLMVFFWVPAVSELEGAEEEEEVVSKKERGRRMTSQSVCRNFAASLECLCVRSASAAAAAATAAHVVPWCSVDADSPQSPCWAAAMCWKASSLRVKYASWRAECERCRANSWQLQLTMCCCDLMVGGGGRGEVCEVMTVVPSARVGVVSRDGRWNVPQLRNETTVALHLASERHLQSKVRN